MPEYRVVTFETVMELPPDDEIVAAQLSEAGTRETSNAVNRALVKIGDDEYICGEELDNGGECQREVGFPDENCWQHTE